MRYVLFAGRRYWCALWWSHLKFSAANYTAPTIHTEHDPGHTPLFYAVRGGHYTTFKLLISKGADLHWGKKNSKAGPTLFHSACMGGNLQIIQELKDADLDMHEKDSNGRTAVLYASRCGRVDVVRALKDWGLDLHAVDDENHNAVHDACMVGNLELLDDLVAWGVDPHLKVDNGCNAAHIACWGGHIKVLRRLKDLGVDVYALDDSGEHVV